ncbi:major facilitator superfamily transporter, partial [Diplocarpon mali]
SRYFLTLTSFQPLYGKLSDIFGRKPCLLFAYTIFGLGCLFCGLARNLHELVAARAFAAFEYDLDRWMLSIFFSGIGGGGMTTVIDLGTPDTMQKGDTGSKFTHSIVYAAGASMGAPLGGILSDGIGWRWAFILQTPLTALAALIVTLALNSDVPQASPPSSPSPTRWASNLRKVDFLGALTLVLAVFTLLIAVDRGSNVAWRDTTTLACLLLSLPLSVAFIYIEMRVARHPFAPGHVIFDRSLFASYACNFFAMASLHGLHVLHPPVSTGRGRDVRHCSWDPPRPGDALLGGGESVRRLADAEDREVLLADDRLPRDERRGHGRRVPNASAQDQAIATACSYLFRSLGSVVGISVAATVLQQSLRTRLIETLDSGEEADRIVEGVKKSLEFIKELEPAVRTLAWHSLFARG